MRSEDQIIKNLDDTLWRAAKAGDLEGVKSAVEKGASVNAGSWFEGNDNDQDIPNYSVLLWAVMSGSLETVEYLCETGADINWAGADAEDALDGVHLPTPILFACKNGHVGIVKSLFSLGAKVPEEHLHYMLSCLHFEINEFLLTQGVNINVQNSDTGDSPLHIAVRQYQIDMVSLFCKNGANVHIKNFKGNTPLHLAIVPSYDGFSLPLVLAVVKVLCQFGARAETLNVEGHTPLDNALRYSDRDVGDFLDAFAEILDILINNMTFFDYLREFRAIVLSSLKINHEFGMRLFSSIITKNQSCFFRHGGSVTDGVAEDFIREVNPSEPLKSVANSRLALSEFYEDLSNNNLKITENLHHSLLKAIKYNDDLVFSDLNAAFKNTNDRLKTQKMQKVILDSLMYLGGKKILTQKNIVKFLSGFSSYLLPRDFLSLCEKIDITLINNDPDLASDYYEIAIKLFEFTDDSLGVIKEGRFPGMEKHLAIAVGKQRVLSLSMLLMNQEKSEDAQFYIMQLLAKLLDLDQSVIINQGRMLAGFDMCKRQKVVEFIIKNNNCESIRADLEKALGIENPKANPERVISLSAGLFSPENPEIKNEEGKRPREEAAEKSTEVKKMKEDADAESLTQLKM